MWLNKGLHFSDEEQRLGWRAPRNIQVQWHLVTKMSLFPLFSTIPIQEVPPRKTSFSGNITPGGCLAPFWEGRYYLESVPRPQHPGHILALDIKVKDTNVVYQDSKRPISKVGGGLP